MISTLGPDAIGVHGYSLTEAIALAGDAGFAGLSFDARAARQAVDERGLAIVQEEFERALVIPAFWNLPVAWRDDERWEQDLAELPALARAARQLGADRVVTYIVPGSNDLPYAENFAWHVARFRRIADILRDEGCQLGIEYVGPVTFRNTFRYPFIHSLAEVLTLNQAVGTGNLGLMLDSWHLYTAGESLADLQQLTARDIVVVHVNDAPAGIPRDEQLDTVRALPLETGVLDLRGFMTTLQGLGYTGPVMPEPFSQRLNALAAHDPLAAARETSRAMHALWRTAGLQ